MKFFIIFQACLTKYTIFLPRQPALYTHTLIQPLLFVSEYNFFQNVQAWILKLKLIFQNVVSLVAIFFFLVLVICLMNFEHLYHRLVP